MNILPYRKNYNWNDPFKELERMQKELLSIVDGGVSQPFGRLEEENHPWLPALDVDENEKEIIVNAELPGVDKNQIQVFVKDGVLTIKGEKKYQNRTKENGYKRNERVFGRFHRVVDLGTSIDESKIQANYKDGILEIHLPKAEQEKPKEVKIDIK